MKKKSILHLMTIMMIAMLCFEFVSCSKDDETKSKKYVNAIVFKYKAETSENIKADYLEVIKDNIAHSFQVKLTNLTTDEETIIKASWNTTINVNLEQGRYSIRAYGESKPISDEPLCTISNEASFEILYEEIMLDGNQVEIALSPSLTCAMIIVPIDHNGWEKVSEYYTKIQNSVHYEYDYPFVKDLSHKCFFAFTEQFGNTTSYDKYLSATKYSGGTYSHIKRVMYTLNNYIYVFDTEDFSYRKYELSKW